MGKIFDALQRYETEKDVAIPERLPSCESGKTMDSVANLGLKRNLFSSNGISPKLFVCTEPDSMDAEIFNVIKGHILFPKDGKPRRTIMVTSAFPAEGKTLVSANLAANLAMGVHESVVLIDCDLRRPSLHKMFGYKNNEGLHEYLTGKRNLEELLIETKIEKLTLLTAGKPASRPADLLGSSMMKNLLADLSNRMDDTFVVLDAVPSQITAEANILANYVDGIVFVILAKHSPREVIKKCTETLGKEKIVGIVFNGYTKAYKDYNRYYKGYYKNGASAPPPTPSGSEAPTL
jgi:protein-tyrosine kinase